jgi:hypothetical protein
LLRYRGGTRLGCAPLISVMETTDFRNREDWPGRYCGSWTMIGGVFEQPQVRSRREDAPEMRLVDDDHVVETLAPDGSDQALNERILPVRSSRATAGEINALQTGTDFWQRSVSRKRSESGREAGFRKCPAEILRCKRSLEREMIVSISSIKRVTEIFVRGSPNLSTALGLPR